MRGKFESETETEYYRRRVQEELRRMELDDENLRRISRESFIAILQEIADRIGVQFGTLLEIFGPLFGNNLPGDPTGPGPNPLPPKPPKPEGPKG